MELPFKSVPCVVWFDIVDQVCDLLHFNIFYDLIQLEKKKPSTAACQKVECRSMNQWHPVQLLVIPAERLVKTQNLL